MALGQQRTYGKNVCSSKLGNAYYSLSQNNKALKIYEDILELSKKVTEKDARKGKTTALGYIGLIYADKGDLDNALKYLKDALSTLDRHNLFYGRDIIKRAIDSIKHDRREEN